jgi:hypothetical protein
MRRVISVPVYLGNLPNIGEAVSRELNTYMPGAIMVLAVVTKRLRIVRDEACVTEVDLILQIEK